jgi:hypothetical protein
LLSLSTYWRGSRGARSTPPYCLCDRLAQPVPLGGGEGGAGQRFRDERERGVILAGHARRFTAPRREPGSPAQLVELRRGRVERRRQRFDDGLFRRLAIAALQLGDVGVVNTGGGS